MDGSAPRAPEDLPAPFVPPDCDLSGFDWFPLHHKRLKQSEWWLSASDLARSRNVDLWAEAFDQVPAASLPDSDVVLAKFAGFGRDVAGWQAAKAEIMAPWVLCSDGRWYHEVLAEVAHDSWERLTKSDSGRAKRSEKARKAAQARWRKDAPSIPGECSEHCPTDARASSEQCHNTDRDRTAQSGEADASPSVSRSGAREGEASVAGWNEVRELYASTVVRGRGSPMLAKSAWLQLEDADRRALPAAIRKFAEAKPWGSNGPPGLQKFIGDDVWREFASSASVTSIVWKGPADLRAAVVAECGEPFARSWLDPATWQAGEGEQEPVLTALTPSATTRLSAVKALRHVAIQSPTLPRRQA